MSSVPNSVASTGSQATNIVDRQRRDNINAKISELLALIPASFFDEYYNRGNSNNESGSSVTDTDINNASRPKGTGTKDGKPNKGQILTQAVEYITYLQNEVDKNNREEFNLMMKIQELSKEEGITVNDLNLENTSAEIMLAKIGVGPLSESATKDDGKNGYSEYSNT